MKDKKEKSIKYIIDIIENQIGDHDFISYLKFNKNTDVVFPLMQKKKNLEMILKTLKDENLKDDCIG